MFQGYSKKDVVTLGFYEGLSENVGLVASGKGQISDNMMAVDCWLLASNETQLTSPDVAVIPVLFQVP